MVLLFGLVFYDGHPGNFSADARSLTVILTLKHKTFSGKQDDVIFRTSVQIREK